MNMRLRSGKNQRRGGGSGPREKVYLKEKPERKSKRFNLTKKRSEPQRGSNQQKVV